MEEKNKNSFQNESLSFADLIDIKKWQKIQDSFSTVTGVGVCTLDPQGKPITLPGGQPRLCTEVIKDPQIKARICESCLPTFLGGKGVIDKNLSFVCWAGLRNFVAPLRANGRVFAYIIVGPVSLVMLKSKEKYRQAAEDLNLSLEDFWNAISEIKVLSFHAAQSLIELIKDVGEYVLRLSYQTIMREKEMMLPDPSKLSRLLDVLLDVAFQISGADLGSIMLIDKNKDELIVRTSKGLSEEVVKKTRVRLGEGIAGMAAKEEKSFIIDDSIKDNRIKRYLNRPQISSSMVIPIKVENRILGVINLGALRTSSVRFGANNVQLINRLINLATIALQ